MPTNKKTSSTNKQGKNGTYAIVEASGKQFWLEADRYYDLDRIKADVNQTISLEKVLLLNNEKETIIGRPYVDGASVQLKVLEHRRGPKLIVYKMRPKKKTRKKSGHRQELTRVMVESISLGGKTAETKTKAKTKSKTSTKSEPESKKDTKTSTVKKSTKTSAKKAAADS